jgi:hypothetical protein
VLQPLPNKQIAELPAEHGIIWLAAEIQSPNMTHVLLELDGHVAAELSSKLMLSFISMTS